MSDRPPLGMPQFRPSEKKTFEVPRDASGRTPTAIGVAVFFGAATAFAALSFAGRSLPDFMESAFTFTVVRWVLLAVAIFALASVLGLEVRMREASRAYVSETQMGEDLIRRAEDAVALTEANRGLNRSAPEDVMFAIARGAAVTVGAKHALVYTHDEDREVMIPVAWTPDSGPEEVPMTHPAGLVALHRQPLLANDPPPPAVAAPVVVGDELVAVVTAFAEDKRFGDRELRLLVSFAADAAVAVTRSRAIQKQQQIADRLTQIDRAKNDFVAAVTHELKTPLTSLLGYASILRKRMDALPIDRREQFFDIMQRQGERILKLIGELLESSRMESGLAKMERRRIDVRYIVENVVSGMRPAARRHNIEVDLPAEDPGLWGDPSAFEHIITNLLDNAIKYSPKRTTVRLWVEAEQTEIRVNVSDEGQGISQDDLPYIFERFRQGDGIERQKNSVGLGLFIVRSLVEAQGGSVSATSQLGKGSTFTVAFPRRADRREPETADARPSIGSLSHENGEPVVILGAPASSEVSSLTEDEETNS